MPSGPPAPLIHLQATACSVEQSLPQDRFDWSMLGSTLSQDCVTQQVCCRAVAGGGRAATLCLSSNAVPCPPLLQGSVLQQQSRPALLHHQVSVASVLRQPPAVAALREREQKVLPVAQVWLIQQQQQQLALTEEERLQRELVVAQQHADSLGHHAGSSRDAAAPQAAVQAATVAAKRAGRLRVSLAYFMAAVGLILRDSLSFDDLLLRELQLLSQQETGSGGLADYAAVRAMHRRWQNLLGTAEVISATTAALHGASVFSICKHTPPHLARPTMVGEEGKRRDERAEEAAASLAHRSLAAAAGADQQQQGEQQEQRPPLLSVVSQRDAVQRYIGFSEQAQQWETCAVSATDGVLLLWEALEHDEQGKVSSATAEEISRMGQMVEQAGSSNAAISQPAHAGICQWWDRKLRLIAFILKKASPVLGQHREAKAGVGSRQHAATGGGTPCSR